jgi:hypothetical protein
MDRVGSQVLEFQTTGVQHGDPSAATTVRRVGTFGITWIYASFLAEQRIKRRLRNVMPMPLPR